MFKPHITVACIVHAAGKLLVVEELIEGQATWNQPAGHLEAEESLIDAARRELYEETGLNYAPEYLIGIHQWVAPDNTPFIRFLFGLDLATCEDTMPHDQDIERCHWLPPEAILTSSCNRSPLVAESVRWWQQGRRYPLSILSTYPA